LYQLDWTQLIAWLLFTTTIIQYHRYFRHRVAQLEESVRLLTLLVHKFVGEA
jgi:hypothetical protein